MFEAKSICLLGRQPELGVAELESLYGADHIQPIDNAALLDIPAEDINFKRLGGSIKVARILQTLPYSDWNKLSKYMRDEIPKHVAMLEPGKITLGLSVYGVSVQLNELNKTMLQVKKAIKTTGRPVRVLQNKTLDLSSATVFHNKLTHKGAWELLLIKNGNSTYVAQTLFVQDIEAYAARDQERPKRDSRVGMLPPKLAQTIINLATGHLYQKQHANLNGLQGADEQRSKSYSKYYARVAESATQQAVKSLDSVDSSAVEQVQAVRVLDPFCGTGVILQEAMLMGYHVLGTDLEPRMVEYSKDNLKWLVEQYPKIESSADVEVGDATDYVWPRFTAIASETYLGRAFSNFPGEIDLKQAISDTNTILKKFLANLSDQMQSGQIACLAVPAWKKPNGQFLHLPLLDHLTEMGYNYLELKHVPNSKLVYYREDQVVARQLIRIEKK